MNNNYGQITRTYTCIAIISALLLIVCGILFFFIKTPYVPAVSITAGAVMLVAVLAARRKRKSIINSYLDILAKNAGQASSNIIEALPIPTAVANIDGTFRWCNNLFVSLFDSKDISGAKIEAVLSGVKWSEILKTQSSYEKKIRIGDESYTLITRTVKQKHTQNDSNDKPTVYMYLIDRSAEDNLKTLYNDERTDIAIINIDNYEDVLQRVNDSEHQQILSKIRQCVTDWASLADALVKNTDRDRYYVFFEHKYLEMYEDKKFDILNKIREVGEEFKLPVSISIGIGIGGSLSENDSYARSALDMALGRGGDQVSIKDDVQYKFYGAKARDYEKSTRVKTRAFAFALKDFINNSDKVIFMGHSGADYDCFGAAIGLQRAVRTLGKIPYIIYDNNSPAILTMYNDLKSNEEYRGMFISGDAAVEMLTPDSLVVILDTHRPSMLPCPSLVQKAAKVVLIDHHRRSTDFINPCSLIYHEPYASSTCEMATELLEYMNLGSSLTITEAEALYTGILMDTKNFIVKTGVRTFEAASYLRKLGLNTVDIKKLFNVSKDDYIYRADIVRTCEIIAPHIALARSYEKLPNIKVIASQASDELLNISDIQASVVVYTMDNAIGISARSLGGINVQAIMEMLGGGGHSTVAGAQIKDKTLDMVADDVKEAVAAYLENN